MCRVPNSRPLGALHSDHKHDSDSVVKDFASPNKKLKLDDDSHHVPIPMSCDDPKVAKNYIGDNSLSPNVLLFSDEEARKHFARWCHLYGATYHSEEEERYRFSVFKKELERVTHQQNLDKPCVINMYSALTLEEKVSLLFCANCDSESDTDTEEHAQEPHAEKEKGYLSEDASEDDAFG